MSANRSPSARPYREEEAARWLAEALAARGIEYTPSPRVGRRRQYELLCATKGCRIPAFRQGGMCWRCEAANRRERERQRNEAVSEQRREARRTKRRAEYDRQRRQGGQEVAA